MASRSTARLEAAAGNPPPISVAGWFRITVRVFGLVVLLLLTVPLHYLWRIVRASSPWPRLFLGAAGRVSGARVTRVGTPLRRDVVFISNHISWIDILAIAGSSGSAFVAKAELRAAPVVGWLCTLNRTVFVSREDRMGVAEQINRLKDALTEAWSVTIFPEGTTTDGRSLLPFKSPLLRVLEPPPPGVMVQPLVLDYGEVGPEIGWIGSELGQYNALRVLARPGSFPVRTIYLEPFHPRDFPGRKAIAAEARARIEAALEPILGGPVPTFVGHDAWSNPDRHQVPLPLVGRG
ncbi:MAG: lysophospholipid acyltransferase family protein [Sphingomonadales bacterium]